MKLQKNGLHFLQMVVIVLFIMALFMPNLPNRILVTVIAVTGIVGTLLLFLIPLLPRLPKLRKHHRPKRKPKVPDNRQPPDMETLLLRQISYQITGKLQSAYPKATWDFIKAPKVERFIGGEPMRIRTNGTKDFNFAEVAMDLYGNLTLSMMTIETLKRQPAGEGTEEAPQVDPESWYTLIGKPLLTNLVGDLQARGHQKLYINEQGEIYIQNGTVPEVKGVFDHFPPKNYWAALSDILIRDELEASETDNALEISWA